MILQHHLSARRPQAIAVIGFFWLVLLLLWIGLGAAWWIVLPFALLTVPAGLEARRGDVANLTLSTTRIQWKSGRHGGTVALKDIDHVRFHTRMDFAVNARLKLTDGSTLRLPVECVPRYATFCTALDIAGVRHERHHFSLF
jgi:hypothetical protein